MIIPAFTFASFLKVMDQEPSYQPIGLEKCRQTIDSFPNGMSRRDVDLLFIKEKKNLGSVFFKRDSTIFMMDVKEKEVVLKHLVSNEYDMSKFCNTFFDVKSRVEEMGGEFTDGRTFDPVRSQA